MDLTIYFEKIVRNFIRYHKYTLGSELRERSREIVGLIIKANPSISRAATPSNSVSVGSPNIVATVRVFPSMR